jgi:DNA-binding MarR family transcriptional regulator
MVATNDQGTPQDDQKEENHDQKKALLESLQKPMTGTELLAAMHAKKCKKTRLRDIWRLLKNMEARRLVYCLTPGEVTGRLYFFTEKGRKVVRQDFKIKVKPLPRLVNWKKYAQVVRAQVRKLVLVHVGTAPLGTSLEAKTVSTIRKELLRTHPMGLGATIRAMRELEQLKLIRCAGITRKRSCALYVPTVAGRRIIEQLKTPPNALPAIYLKMSDAEMSNGEEKENKKIREKE